MKKTIILCMIAALSLTACGSDLPAAAPVNADGDSEIAADAPDIAQEEPDEGAICGTYWTDEDLPVSARTEQGSYRPDTEVIRVTVTNRTDAEYCFAESEFRLYRMENGRETEVPYAEGKDCFTCMAQIAPPQDSTVFIAKIAEHYDLPLNEGVYTLHIGEAGADSLVTGFEIAADAPLPAEPAQTDFVLISAEPAEYPAGTEQITVVLTNTGSETEDVSFADFGLEQFLGEAVSYTPFSREPVAHFADIRGVQLEPGKTYEWKVSLADFGITAPENGSYAIFYNGQEAGFVIG